MTRTGSPGAAAVLRKLVATCREGEHRFLTAADQVADPTLKRLFQTYAEERAGFARELGRELASLGSLSTDPRDGGTPPDPASAGIGSVRDWADESTLAAECERGEQECLAAYGKALRRRLPEAAGATVERQYHQVKDAHRHVRSLERALAGQA
jgi:uncharacterized protein (TIGR02284 family)